MKAKIITFAAVLLAMASCCHNKERDLAGTIIMDTSYTKHLYAIEFFTFDTGFVVKRDVAYKSISDDKFFDYTSAKFKYKVDGKYIYTFVADTIKGNAFYDTVDILGIDNSGIIYNLNEDMSFGKPFHQ